jgi:hypothetical protein
VRGSAARGGASVLWLWAGLTCAPARALATEPALAPEGVANPAASGDSVAAEGGAGVLEGRPIARVDVEPHDIFEGLPAGRLGGLFRLGDRLHVRTRSSTIRHHMLIAPGEPWNEARARETERVLRALDIFDVVRVRGQASGDSAAVTVWTRDAWTTSPDFSLERGGGQVFGSVRFSEHNLFGRAKQIGVAYRQDPTGISRSIDVADPGVAGTRVRAALSASQGSSGTASFLSVGLPFYAEDTRFSFGVRAERAHTTARLFEQGAEVASFARRFEQVQLSVGRGRRLGRMIARLTGSLLILDRSFGGSAVEPGVPGAFAGGEERLRVRRFLAEGRLWRPAFVERTVVERLDGIEDFDLGRSLGLGIGYGPRALGATVEDGVATMRVDAGADAGRAGFGMLRFGVNSRLVSGFRETSGQVEARWANQTIPRHTLVIAALGAGGWDMPRDFQLVVGGLNGLRAHDVHALAGNRLWRINTESRWVIGRDFQSLFSLGAAAFWDAARTAGPGSAGAPWQHDLGFGLRIGLPRSAQNRVARFDVAWPVAPGSHTLREAVFSFGSSQAF